MLAPSVDAKRSLKLACERRWHPQLRKGLPEPASKVGARFAGRALRQDLRSTREKPLHQNSLKRVQGQGHERVPLQPNYSLSIALRKMLYESCA